MTGDQMLQAAVLCEKTERAPVAPMVLFYAARHAGMTMECFVHDQRKAFGAIKQTFADHGGWDILYAPCGYDPLIYSMEVPVRLRLPGKDLPPDEIWQAEEREVIEVEDYRTIIRKGWNWYFYRVVLPRIRPGYGGRFPGRLRFNLEVVRILMFMLSTVRYWNRKHVPSLIASSASHPFELLSYGRSFVSFFIDLYERPDTVLGAMDAVLPDIIKQGIQSARLTRIPRVMVGGSRGAAQFVSLEFFERFYFPYLKAMIEAFHKAGITSVLHFDSNWTDNLEYFLDLPRHSCILELDGTTDIFRAKEVLKGHLCIMGDVPAQLLVFGTCEEVKAYCRKLLEGPGRDGGFILSSGCEVPPNARPENVQALLDSVKERGRKRYVRGTVMPSFLSR